MGNLLEYSGIVTKTRAMEAKLLTPAQFVTNFLNLPLRIGFKLFVEIHPLFVKFFI